MIKNIILTSILISTTSFAAEWSCYGQIKGTAFNQTIVLPKVYNPQSDKRVNLLTKDGLTLSVTGDDSFMSLSDEKNTLVEISGSRLYYSNTLSNMSVVCNLVN